MRPRSAGRTLTDVCRITDVWDLPVLVDMNAGSGPQLSTSRRTKSLIKSGSAARHFEDQVGTKRCDHAPNKHFQLGNAQPAV
jgi:methylisocitrate lyase